MPQDESESLHKEKLKEPVEYLKSDTSRANPGIALSLSGGGYRAMLFHVGSIWRLYETGLLGRVDRFSSVSGGSITAALLGLGWKKIQPSAGYDRQRIQKNLVGPIRGLADETIDAWAIVGGILLPGTISEKIQGAYRKHLYGDATLQDLPDQPRFVMNATNVQSGALWRFSKPYMRDYRVGEVKNPTVPLAEAVGASSAFPPVLSPMILELDPSKFTPASGEELQREPFTSRVVLSDGGVYDNLGLETTWKNYETILVSDAGGKMQPEEEPKEDWARHSYRVLDLIDNQVRSLRKRQIIQSYKDGVRKGTYWGIRTNIADYGLPDSLPCPFNRTMELAAIPTRLKRLSKDLQERLINWGYAVCDTAIRTHVEPTLPRPAEFPYPGAAV